MGDGVERGLRGFLWMYMQLKGYHVAYEKLIVWKQVKY